MKPQSNIVFGWWNIMWRMHGQSMNGILVNQYTCKDVEGGLNWQTKQKYHTGGTIPKSNIKMSERDKIDTINTPIR
jgi:hypothetical protein